MSKKSRKNSSKTATKKAAPAKSRAPVKKTAAGVSARPSKKTAKTAVTKSAVKKPAKKATRPATKTTPQASHKVEAKTLKPARAAKSAAASPVAASAKSTSPTRPIKPKTVPQPAPAIAIEGATAPPFTLPRDGGTSVSLADFAGQKLVIFFYPRADTPGCTKEAIDFTRLASAFAAGKTAVLGVSADPLKAQEAFRDKHGLSTALMSDETHAMLEAYGAWGEKSMYGRTFQGVLRTTVLIASDGSVARIWRNVKVDGHADEVLDVARGL